MHFQVCYQTENFLATEQNLTGSFLYYSVPLHAGRSVPSQKQMLLFSRAFLPFFLLSFVHLTFQSVEAIHQKRLSRASDRPSFDLRVIWNPIPP